MKHWILCLTLWALTLPAFAQTARPSLAERSKQTEAVAKPYFEAYIARDWDRLEPMLDERSRFDDATAAALFGTQAKQGKAEQMKFFREAFAAIRAMRFHPTSQFVSGEHMVFVGELEWSLSLPDGLVVDTRMPFVVRLQVRDGKVLEHLDTADYKPFVVALQKARAAASKS
ncbi:MAG: nuclear transport factor 2 family protein [Burkholderiales bacterium]|uniref:nuclear transport factor 2 family protein n=1 Tax=Inhella sp. TaxID=1921806 RepID=UPI001AD08DDD|nr:nuclear transport factor 2 family protein [Burkholderiales bacterium]